jgi:hypothetical protein
MTAGTSEDPPEEDSVGAFGRDLRLLRLDAGSPTYGAIARTANLSKSIVADAFGGVRLPTERTLHGIVSALDEATEPWLVRRAALAESRRRSPEQPEQGTGPGSARRPRWLRSAALLGVGLLVGLVLGGSLALWLDRGPRGVPLTAPSPGADVATSGCLGDAVPVARLERPGGTVELMHSARCGGWWAHVRHPADGGTLTVRLYPLTSAAGAADSGGTVLSTASATEVTTPLLVGGRTAAVCVQVDVAPVAAGVPVPFGEPLCG